MAQRTRSLNWEEPRNRNAPAEISSNPNQGVAASEAGSYRATREKVVCSNWHSTLQKVVKVVPDEQGSQHRE